MPYFSINLRAEFALVIGRHVILLKGYVEENARNYITFNVHLQLSLSSRD